jgi:hypothetical protein
MDLVLNSQRVFEKISIEKMTSEEVYEVSMKLG